MPGDTGPPAGSEVSEANEGAAPDVAASEIPEGTTDAADARSACALDSPTEKWVDRMQMGVMQTLCAATRWFDGYFGDPSHDYHTRYGRIGLALVYDEIDDIDVDTEFKARIDLPNLEHRFSTFIGQFDEDDFVQDRQDEFTALPEVFRSTEDEEWLVGLGYRPAGGRTSRFDVDAGVRVRFPLDPFVKGRYRYWKPFGDRNLLRLRETVFWRNALGFGATTSLDLERMLFGGRILGRWRTEATAAQEVDGVDWKTSVTLYQRVGDDGALAYQAVWDGETEAPVTVDEAGLRVVFRHRFLRDWLFLEARLRSRWVREAHHEPREHSFGAAFGFEMLFGRDHL